MRDALEQRNSGLRALCAVMNGDFVLFVRIALPQRHAGVRAVLAQDVVGHVNELQLAHVIVVVAGDALERVKAGVERRHAVPHVLDDGVCSRDLNVLFSAAGGSRRTHVLIGVATGADDRRITAASGEFVGKATGGCTAGDFTLLVESGTMNRAGGWKQNAPDGGHTEFRLNSKLGGALFQALDSLFPKLGLRRGRW